MAKIKELKTEKYDLKIIFKSGTSCTTVDVHNNAVPTSIYIYIQTLIIKLCRTQYVLRKV